jgi:hypothetical protein
MNGHCCVIGKALPNQKERDDDGDHEKAEVGLEG